MQADKAWRHYSLILERQHRQPIPGSAPSAIYRLELNTGKLTTLKGSQGAQVPKLSPDGSHLAALSDANHLVLFDMKAEQ